MPEPRSEAIFFTSPDEFREWLETNHGFAREVLVGFFKKSTGKPSMTWPQSVDEALCFGWIDGVRRGVDDERYTIRFTPRKSRSIWSTVNIKRAGELIAEGRMRPAGIDTFESRDPANTNRYSFEQTGRGAVLDEEFTRIFREHDEAWAYFEEEAPSYRRAAIWWVVSAKREQTRRSRLTMLVEASERKKRLRHLTPYPRTAPDRTE